MKKKQLSGVLLVGGLVVAIGAFMVHQIRRDDVRITNLSPRSGEATASSEFLNAQKSVEYYREQIKISPQNPKHYVELAQLYIQEARVTALHHEYFPKAERLLDKALEIAPDDFNALVTKASMQATLHRFEEAKLTIQKAIAINPHNAYAYGILCDTYVELGEYDEAVKTCDKMLSIRPDLRSYARASYLREIFGDNRGAMIAMQMAGDAGVPGQEARAWCFYNLGKVYLTEGKLDTAELIFHGILAERPKYAYALSGLAHVRAAQQQWDETVDLLRKAWESMPDHSFLEDLVAAYRAIDNKQLANKTTELVLQEFSDHIKEGWNVDKEFAMFCADHGIELGQALVSARREYERRPKNIDALDAYAWTLFKNGRAAEAKPLIEEAMRLGTHNVGMKYHAAMIYRALGESAKAATLLQEVSRMNPYAKLVYAHEVKSALTEPPAMASK
ncbi:MAG: tetratricopeptide repeat protein [Ignavibacteriae bacterium]|nr:tetratricopeptide repeat protein [Ignavibacteriota bacterium]